METACRAVWSEWAMKPSDWETCSIFHEFRFLESKSYFPYVDWLGGPLWDLFLTPDAWKQVNNLMPFECCVVCLQPAKVLYLHLSAFLFTTPIPRVPWSKHLKSGDEAPSI